MLNDRQRDALRRWYRRSEVTEEINRLVRREDWEALEEYIQMRALFDLSRHSELPDYLRDGANPLIPSNCNPRASEEDWQDAIEVAWEVMEADFQLSRDAVHLKIKEWQERSWEAFLQSVEERKRARQPSKSDEH